MDKYFRVKKSGAILPYNERLVGNKDVELVTEQEAFPEKFAAKAVLEHEANIKIDVPEKAIPPKFVPPELEAEASVAWGGLRSRANKASKGAGLKGE